MTSAWRQMDQLLTCGQCSDRFRNPRLLPCQHTFCMEPCLERLVDHGRHQVKCPECGAEHRVPFQGVQTFPNNVTLVRFLELRGSLNGQEPEPPPCMQRCPVCKEKAKLEMCAHCDKKVCLDCKKAHLDIIRKEIVLINGQVREGLDHLTNVLNQTEKNVDKLQKNYGQVKDEIEELVRRYTRDLLDTEEKLKHELEVYLQTEQRSLLKMQDDLQVEVNNVNSNCDLVDKYITNGVDWTDAELMDYKEIFQRTVDFLRNFDLDTTDFTRRVKFHLRTDSDVLHKTLLDFGEVKVLANILASNNANGNLSVNLAPPQNSALMRSYSDNRLASQLRQQESKNIQNGRRDAEGDASATYRRIKERLARDRESMERELGSGEDARGRLMSRGDIGDDDSDPNRIIRFQEPQQREKDRVCDTEDATKGPLSGVIKISDSPHVMERLHQSEVRQKKQQEEEERRAREPPPPPPPVFHSRVNRQVSEDEIEKQKKQNQAAAAATATTTPSAVPDPPVRSLSRTSSVQKEEVVSGRQKEDRNRSSDEVKSRFQTEDSEVTTPRIRPWRTSSTIAPDSERPLSPEANRTARDSHKPPVSPRQRELLPPPRPSRPPISKTTSLDVEDKPKREEPPPHRRLALLGKSLSLEKKEEEKHPPPRVTFSSRHTEEEAKESSDSSDSDTNTDSEEAQSRGDISPSVNTLLARSAQARKQSASTTAFRLGNKEDEPRRPSRTWRDSIKKDDKYCPHDGYLSNRRRPEVSEESSPYSRMLTDRRRSLAGLRNSSRDGSPEEPIYNSDRFRNESSAAALRRNRIARSKSSHDIGLVDDGSDEDVKCRIDRTSRTRRSRDRSPEETPWSQYLRNKYGTSHSTTPRPVTRSKTSSVLATHSDSDSSDDGTPSPKTGRRYDHSSHSPRGFSLPRRTYMQKGKTSFKIGTRGTDPGCFTWPRGVAVGQDNTIIVADSSNHRVQVFSSTGKFVQEFGVYGNNEGEFDCLAAVTVNRIGQFIISDRYNHRIQVFDPSGRFIRSFGSEGRGDGRFSYPWGVATDSLGFVYVCDKENHRIQVFQGDGTFVTKFGSIGQRPGELEHPHYITVSSTNRVIVSDSNNHRVQIFDVNGRLLSTFGSEGSEEGQFKFPRGVAVDDQGYVIVGDSGNNRIQVFHPDGTFLKAFGSWGAGDGEFKGLEGIAVMNNGNILVCDRENHRIQVF